MSKYTLFVGAGALFLWVVACMPVCASRPEIYSPLSLAVTIPALMLEDVFRVDSSIFRSVIALTASGILPALFLAWSFPLFKGQVQIPLRTIILAICLIILSTTWLLRSWSYGVQYQGSQYTLTMYLFNFCFWIILFFLFYTNYQRASFTTNFLFHVILFAWFGWVAFPWLGELP